MPEPNSYTFRTAVGGFHKGDVTAYISKTASAHQTALAALQKQVETLEQENASLREQLQMLSLPNLLDQMAPEPAPDAAPQSEPVDPPDPSLKERELLAYRRAEAAERLACQRAKKLYSDIQHICDDSAASMDDADAVTREALEIILAQLQRVRNSVDGLSGVIQASSESLRAMGDMVPDPAEGMEEEL